MNRYCKAIFSVGLILGALFFGLGYLAGCGLLDSFTEKMARNFSFRIWNSARPGIFLAMLLARSLPAYFFSISPHINFWLVSLFGAVFMMINMRFKDKDHQCVAADAGGSKKRILSQFSRIETSGFSSYLLWGRGLSITFFDQQLFSCLLCRFIRITRCRNAPVWLSQLIPSGTRSAVHGDYSFLCESGRAKKCITYRSCDYGVAYPFLRAVR